jgi:putative transcriptional regulator
MSKTAIKNNVRKLRFYNDEMTQQQLADHTGVSRQTIVSIEKGKYSPSLELAFRMAHVFKCTLDELFNYNPEEDAVLKKIKSKK